MTPLVLLMLVTMARSQETTPDYTCSQDSDCQTEECPDAWCQNGFCGWPWVDRCIPWPMDGCLPYDGSVIPDCLNLVDPITKQPYYLKHSHSKLEL